MSRYAHTQRSPLYLLLMAVALTIGIWGMLTGDDVPGMQLGLFGLSAMFVVISACFAKLTVRDDGDKLVVRFGWLPAFGWSARWEDIESARQGKSALIDGWGIHWIPGRGTTVNLWGFDCVELRVKGRIVRVGTDDAQKLTGYIRERISRENSE